MKLPSGYRNFPWRALADWLENSLHNIAAFSFCLVVFTGVYSYGRFTGESDGRAMTTASFEKCGQPRCRSDAFFPVEPGP
jgi:hypothetical protein